MKFHTPSFLLGVAVAAGAILAREQLRPVAVEVGALAIHLSRIARGIVARQREEIEDLFAEIEDRVRERVRAEPKGAKAHHPFVNGEARA